MRGELMRAEMEIRKLEADMLTEDMLLGFKHHQVILKKWINKHERWELIDTFEVREWNEEKRKWIPKYLQQQIERGGSAVGAYIKDNLVGFCCIDGIEEIKGCQYANVTMLFVDDDYQNMGLGKALFTSICESAKKLKAEKLFISAIPSMETIAFYFQMGCIDAQEIIPKFVDTENDRYLEYALIQ